MNAANSAMQICIHTTQSHPGQTELWSYGEVEHKVGQMRLKGPKIEDEGLDCGGTRVNQQCLIMLCSQLVGINGVYQWSVISELLGSFVVYCSTCYILESDTDSLSVIGQGCSGPFCPGNTTWGGNTPCMDNQSISEHHAHTYSHTDSNLGTIESTAIFWEVGGNWTTWRTWGEHAQKLLTDCKPSSGSNLEPWCWSISKELHKFHKRLNTQSTWKYSNIILIM